MSLENRVGRVNGILNRISQIPEAVGAWIRIVNVLRTIQRADKAAANGDIGSYLIASFATPRGYGQHVNWYELRLDPNNNDHRRELGEISRTLRASLRLRDPFKAIEVSRSLDRKILEAQPNGSL